MAEGEASGPRPACTPCCRLYQQKATRGQREGLVHDAHPVPAVPSTLWSYSLVSFSGQPIKQQPLSPFTDDGASPEPSGDLLETTESGDASTRQQMWPLPRPPPPMQPPGLFFRRSPLPQGCRLLQASLPVTATLASLGALLPYPWCLSAAPYPLPIQLRGVGGTWGSPREAAVTSDPVVASHPTSSRRWTKGSLGDSLLVW